MLDPLNSNNVWLFVFVVLPGFLSMRIYGLLRPIERITLKILFWRQLRSA
jgi:hypothetical protein